MILLLTFDSEEEKVKFSVIYEDYAEFMVRVARRFLHDSPDSEDIVQEVFLYVADHLEKIDLSNRQKTRSYLAILTEHKAYDYLRRKHSEIAFDEQELDCSLRVDVSLDEGEDLARALALLPAESREILLLHYYSGYTYHEIADLFGQSVFAVRSKARRAKKKLAQILDKSE